MFEGKRKWNRNLLILLLGRMVSDIGTTMQMVIIPLYIIDTGGSAATVGLFSFMALAPALLVYPFAGVLGDRLNRKKIMVGTDIASASVILCLAIISYYGKLNINILLMTTVIVSLLNGLFDPATKGMVPQLVAKDDLNTANSAVASLRTLSALLGPVIGAMLYVNVGITILFLVNATSYMISACSEMLIRYQHTPRETTTGFQGILADMSEGIRHIWVNRMIRKLCLYFLITYALIQPIFSVVLPLLFKTQLAYSDVQYGYLQGIIVAGALAGSILVGVLFGKDKKVSQSVMLGSFLLMGMMLSFSILLFPYSLFVLGNGSTMYFTVIAVVLFLLSMAILFIHIPVQTFIQANTPEKYMSRAFSIVGLISKGGIPLGALIYGLILSSIQIHWTVFAATLLTILFSITFIISLNWKKSTSKKDTIKQ